MKFSFLLSQDKICSSILIGSKLEPPVPFSHVPLPWRSGQGSWCPFYRVLEPLVLEYKEICVISLACHCFCILLAQAFGIFESMGIVFCLLGKPRDHWTVCSYSVCKGSWFSDQWIPSYWPLVSCASSHKFLFFSCSVSSQCFQTQNCLVFVRVCWRLWKSSWVLWHVPQTSIPRPGARRQEFTCCFANRGSI